MSDEELLTAVEALGSPATQSVIRGVVAQAGVQMIPAIQQFGAQGMQMLQQSLGKLYVTALRTSACASPRHACTTPATTSVPTFPQSHSSTG